MTNKQTPIPQDKIGESFVWRDWFQKLSDRVFGNLSTQDANNVNITGGTIQVSSLTTNTLYVPSGTDGQVLIGSTADHSFAPATLTAGTNITITNAAGSITIASTGSGTGNVVGPASATDNAIARFDTTTGKLIQDSVVLVSDTGDVSGLLSQQFSNGSAVTFAAGKMWYDGTTGSWNLGMGNGNITQQVGEEQFIYGKASAAITDSPLQIIYHTGTVGASGVITFAPTVSGLTNPNDIIGVATESLALNAFGRITTFGVIHNITTDGAVFSETWADDDVIWYNPTTGNPTNVKPTAPNMKMQIGLVIKAGPGGSGSFQVLLNPGSTLGETDSNVQFGTLANNNLIAYDSALQYWKNVTPGSVTGVGSVANALTAGSGLNGSTFNGSAAVTWTLATAYGDTINPYASKTANYFLAAPNGSAGVPTFRAVVAADIPTLNQNTTGTAANITATTNSTLTTLSALSLPGSQVTGNISGNAANVTGVVAAANGGTGQSSYTIGDILYASGTTTISKLTAGTANYVLTSNGPGVAPSWAASSGGGATITNDTSTSTNVYPLFASATSGGLATAYTSNAKYLYKPSTGELTASIVTASNGIHVNSKTVATSYTIATGYSAMSAGPITVASGQSVTLSSGSRWVIL